MGGLSGPILKLKEEGFDKRIHMRCEISRSRMVVFVASYFTQNFSMAFPHFFRGKDHFSPFSSLLVLNFVEVSSIGCKSGFTSTYNDVPVNSYI